MHLISNKFLEKTALVEGEINLSYAQLHDEVSRLANQIHKLPDGILLLTATPSIQFVIQLMAALQCDKPVALCPTTLSEQELQNRLSILDTAMTVDSNGNLLDFYEKKTTKHHPLLALILFTSGTTGQVKAVQLSAKNIASNCLAVIKALNFPNVKSQLLFLPLSYSYGLLGQLLPGLMCGHTIQLVSQFTDLKNILEHGPIPQMWSGVPSHWVAISRMAAAYPENAKQITAIVSAGAPLPTSLRTELYTFFNQTIIYNNYGLTEASPRVLTYSSQDPHFFEDYAGYPVGDWQIKLSEDQELLLQGSQMMLGYLGDEENEKIHNGWLHTGDIAEILPNGLVAIKGRRDNQVNIGGEKVNLAEIEQKLCQMNEIKEVIVLPLEDELYGTRLIACFEQSTLSTNLTELQLTEHIQQHLLPRKIPISARILDSLPRNQHGKLDRKTLLANTKNFDQKESHHVKR
ncbi:class I adenylate-forming enzyme family protein [Legionella bononiensis]|uniref:Acyl--CoA ligase n=1 Tax=Legionella bononiensis TaxID=2793102 RepID=A0ABS1W6Z6_9GAMM|nr:class I adenylate-forming enzyme family protein [Legionella bononiensis]MBL7481236.1 acyl--CoA ligase [Legionella bononiensis]MBL7525142.1 acyl--CoA ligase [Legionella bononiensis]MBL7562866.1 acyl--CoA ligase [Legionella bononiensis]